MHSMIAHKHKAGSEKRLARQRKVRFITAILDVLVKMYRKTISKWISQEQKGDRYGPIHFP